MSVLPTGEASLDIQGLLQDIINNFNSLVTDLQAQGIDPSFLKSAFVTIHAAVPNVPASVFSSAETAITTWRGTVAGTSIIVSVRFAVKG